MEKMGVEVGKEWDSLLACCWGLIGLAVHAETPGQPANPGAGVGGTTSIVALVVSQVNLAPTMAAQSTGEGRVRRQLCIDDQCLF